MSSIYRAYAPASSANLSVGFDLLGIAVRPCDGTYLGDFVESRELLDTEKGNVIDDLSIVCSGRFVHKLPEDPKENILFDAYQSYSKILNEHGLKIKRLELKLEKNLPVCSGLGSSSASVVAAVLALNAIHDNFLNEDKCMKLMGELEGKISGSIHYDNVAPCYLGGMQLIVNEDHCISENIPFFENWYYVLCFPGVKVSTAAARSILPAQYLRRDVINFGRRLSTFIHASYKKDEKLALKMLVDVIAEPYRASLIPNFKEARLFGEALGSFATGISGSGSTVFSIFTDKEKAEKMKQYLEREFIANEDGFCHICRVDERGAFVEEVKV